MTPDIDISVIASIFFQRFPQIFLYVIGIIFAVTAWHRCPRPSQYVVLGLGVLLFQTIGSGLFYSLGAAQLRESGMMELVSWGFRLLFIAGMVLILIAAFVDRPTKN